MERLVYRSTSITDLQAEMRQRDLLDEAGRRVLRRPTARRRTLLDRWLAGRRGRD